MAADCEHARRSLIDSVVGDGDVSSIGADANTGRGAHRRLEEVENIVVVDDVVGVVVWTERSERQYALGRQASRRRADVVIGNEVAAVCATGGGADQDVAACDGGR